MISGQKDYPQVVHSIVTALIQRHNLVLDENGLINGVDIGIEVKEEWSDGSWRKNGRIQVRVGTSWTYHGVFRNVGYRQKSDGTFSYDKIADKIADYYQQALVHNASTNELRSSIEASRLFIDSLERDLGVYDAEVDYSDKTGNLYFKIMGIKPWQARKFAELAKEMGLLHEKK